MTATPASRRPRPPRGGARIPDHLRTAPGHPRRHPAAQHPPTSSTSAPKIVEPVRHSRGQRERTKRSRVDFEVVFGPKASAIWAGARLADQAASTSTPCTWARPALLIRPWTGGEFPDSRWAHQPGRGRRRMPDEAAEADDRQEVGESLSSEFRLDVYGEVALIAAIEVVPVLRCRRIFMHRSIRSRLVP